MLAVLMPQLYAIEVCRRLEAEPETRAIEILRITGHPDLTPPVMVAGADGCLAKPLDFEQLRHHVDRLFPSTEA
jgi:CheY-like chemotaxis protein